MHSEGLAELRRAVNLSGGRATWLGSLGLDYGEAGERDEALNILRQLKERSRQGYVDPMSLALVYLGLGEKDQAFAWLEKAYEERSLMETFLKASPGFAPLRSDPRFQDLLRRMNLPP